MEAGAVVESTSYVWPVRVTCDPCAAHPRSEEHDLPPGTVETLIGLAFAALVLILILEPAYQAGRDNSGAVDVEARRVPDAVVVRLARFPLTRSVVVRSVAVSRELADELGLEIPEGFRFAQDLRWLTAEARVPLGDGPVELRFTASREPRGPVAGSVRVVSTYRPGLRRIRHYTVQPVAASPEGDAEGAL